MGLISFTSIVICNKNATYEWKICNLFDNLRSPLNYCVIVQFWAYKLYVEARRLNKVGFENYLSFYSKMSLFLASTPDIQINLWIQLSGYLYSFCLIESLWTCYIYCKIIKRTLGYQHLLCVWIPIRHRIVTRLKMNDSWAIPLTPDMKFITLQYS